jgi:hypothetical protein
LRLRPRVGSQKKRRLIVGIKLLFLERVLVDAVARLKGWRFVEARAEANVGIGLHDVEQIYIYLIEVNLKAVVSVAHE